MALKEENEYSSHKGADSDRCQDTCNPSHYVRYRLFKKEVYLVGREVVGTYRYLKARINVRRSMRCLGFLETSSGLLCGRLLVIFLPKTLREQKASLFILCVYSGSVVNGHII
ncbi:hypothetical protein EVAR_63478_1 [Eumeta japonica]|uniref:Uncharacterized protein n=1 Tax=Eumeta variegata TaxID=151549 RepID=A0A4C2AH80_EUMVA|nr:hypothetical protein EVAR_63478_1 [Eumeta japonica]